MRFSSEMITPRAILSYLFLGSKAFINDSEEKDRVLDLAEARLKEIGVLPDQPRTYCTVGLAEIQTGSTIGKLLKVK